MNTYGDRPNRDAAEAIARRRITTVGIELKPIVHITTPCHGRHDRPYGVREWGVFLGDQCVAYVNATRTGQLKLWPYSLGENQYRIEENAMKWTRTETGRYMAGDYELIPVGFRRRREGYVVQHKGVHVDTCSTLVRAKARAERHRGAQP